MVQRRKRGNRGENQRFENPSLKQNVDSRRECESQNAAAVERRKQSVLEFSFTPYERQWYLLRPQTEFRRRNSRHMRNEQETPATIYTTPIASSHGCLCENPAPVCCHQLPTDAPNFGDLNTTNRPSSNEQQPPFDDETVGLTIWRLPGGEFVVGQFSGGRRELPVVYNNGVPMRISWGTRGEVVGLEEHGL
nr:probable E3 ubiquitin-protein ligase RHC2A [Ipomoea trifida]